MLFSLLEGEILLEKWRRKDFPAEKANNKEGMEQISGKHKKTTKLRENACNYPLLYLYISYTKL